MYSMQINDGECKNVVSLDIDIYETLECLVLHLGCILRMFGAPTHVSRGPVLRKCEPGTCSSPGPSRRVVRGLTLRSPEIPRLFRH